MPSPRRQHRKPLPTPPDTYQDWQSRIQTIKVMSQELLYALNQAHPAVNLTWIRDAEKLCDRAEQLRQQITQATSESMATSTESVCT